MLYIDSYLCFSEVSQSEVKSPEVVEDLGRHVGLHLLLQDAGGRAVRRQRSLNVGLLQDLSQLDPRLHVVWVLLRHLLQMTLVNRDSDTLRADSRHISEILVSCNVLISRYITKTIKYSDVLWRCLFFPDRQMSHRETQEFS